MDSAESEGKRKLLVNGKRCAYTAPCVKTAVSQVEPGEETTKNPSGMINKIREDVGAWITV